MRDWLAGIEATIDDVQAGSEACSRAAAALIADTSKFNGSLKGPLLRALTRHGKDLQACARDQQAALLELRTALDLLRNELSVPKRAASKRPPLASAVAEEV